MYDDTKDFIRRCIPCQKHGNINARDAMTLTTNLQLELFDVWGIDYMGPFPKSQQCEYILVAVDYVSKWVEALPCWATDSNNAKRMFSETIFPCCPHLIRMFLICLFDVSDCPLDWGWYCIAMLWWTPWSNKKRRNLLSMSEDLRH